MQIPFPRSKFSVVLHFTKFNFNICRCYATRQNLKLKKSGIDTMGYRLRYASFIPHIVDENVPTPHPSWLLRTPHKKDFSATLQKLFCRLVSLTARIIFPPVTFARIHFYASLRFAYMRAQKLPPPSLPQWRGGCATQKKM